jgi:hypothetical protein
MFLLRSNWGKVVFQEDFVDVQKVAVFDEVKRRCQAAGPGFAPTPSVSQHHGLGPLT